MKAEDEGLELVGWNTARGHEAIDEQPMDESLTQRAEELLQESRRDERFGEPQPPRTLEQLNDLIEQLLSENRQVRAEARAFVEQVGFEHGQELRAEREAFERSGKAVYGESFSDNIAAHRRILAENDR